MIDPVSAAAAGAALAEINNGLAGMSLADAYNTYMDSTYDDTSGISIGVGNWTSDKPAITGDASESIYDSNEDTALEAWTDWMHEKPDLVDETTGGACLGSDAKTINYALLDTVIGSSPVVQAIQPVAVPLGYAVLALSQALGVSMDYAQMDLATKAEITAAYQEAGAVMYDKARELCMAWWDGVNILFPKRSAEAMEDALETLGIGGNSWSGNIPADNPYDCPPFSISQEAVCNIQATGTGYTNLKFSVPIFVVTNGTVYSFSDGYGTSRFSGEWWSNGSYRQTEYGNVPNYFSRYTKDGKTVIYGPSGKDFDRANAPFLPSSQVPYDKAGLAAWVALYGGYAHQGYYPIGTEASEAPKYTSGTLPLAGAVAKGAASTEPVVKVSLPLGKESTIGSTEDPGGATDPNRVKDLPVPPIPLPIPDTNVSDPDIGLANPSRVDEEVAKKVDELVEDLANTVDPQPPQSTGLAPLPYMPGTPVIDPETGEPTGETVYPSIVPSSGSGLIHVYNPTPAEFMAFGQWLWVTYADATIDKIWNNPFDGIIGAFELYSTPSIDGRDNIRSGFLVCPTSANLVRQRYTEINCGTVVVPEFYGNYLDYSPYSQCYIYLPFIGINEVSIDDIVGHAVNIRYRVDAYNGSCIAMIYVAKDGYENLCYQFAGNCAVEVPLAGGSQAAIKAGMMQAEAYGRAAVQSAQIQKTASIGTGIVNGASAGAGAGAMNPIAGIVGGLLGALAGGTSGYIQGSANYGAAKLNAGAMQEAARVANKSSVQHSGSFGSSHGAMGNKIPFLIIRNPIQVKVVNYNDDYGFPAHKRVIIGGCTGYLRVREVNVISAFATNEEKIAIEEALKMGVYVT